VTEVCEVNYVFAIQSYTLTTLVEGVIN